MNVQSSLDFLRHYPDQNEKLADIYDTDGFMRDALSVLFPEFEYPDYSYLTVGQLLAKGEKNATRT